ncbi:MAG: T9SS type A sorting domain-containing protein [Saprospiraceae bacterium]
MKKQLFILLLIFLISNTFLLAQGSDNANDVAYNPGWNNGTNGGSGFGAWGMNPSSNNGNTGFFIGSSDIDVSGESWGIYSNSGNLAESIRNFLASPDAADIITVNMDNGNIDNGGSVGVGLRNASGENLLEVFFEGGSSNYIVNDASGQNDSGLGYSNTGISIEITMSTATTYSAKLTNLSSMATQTVIGNLINPAGGQVITQFRIFNFNAGSGSISDQFFNSLEHVALTPLPIELSSFSARPIDEKVYLDWSTSSEINNEFFTIEKSLDGIEFIAIGIEEGRGDSNVKNNYQFIDGNPKNGVNYYRLKQTDFDGKFEYSDVVSIKIESDNSTHFFPNPAKEKLTIATDLEEVQIEIYNINGQLIYANNQLDIDLSNFQSGIYFLQMKNKSGNIFFTDQFVKQ